MNAHTPDAIREAFRLGAPAQTPATLFGAGQWSVYQLGCSMREVATDPDRMTAALLEAQRKAPSPIVFVGSGFNNQLIGALGGRIRYPRLGAPEVGVPIIQDSADEVDRLDLSEVDRDPAVFTVRQTARAVGQALGPAAIVAVTQWGPFTTAGQMYGLDGFLRATLTAPEVVHRMTGFAVLALKQYFRPLLEEKQIGLISLADHSASSDLISRKAFAKFCLPPLMDFIDWAKKAYRVDTWLHICGNTADKWDLMVETGAVCLSLDQKVDLGQARRVCRGRVCLAGNIDPVQVMDQGGISDVLAAVQRCREAAGREGFILTTGCEMTPTTPLGNVQAMLDNER
ncbi:MAG: uroporphyrinogen decarboxylase family protein [Anaerolineales bacterium]|nr:uroporphyrinogen decarboxylase family protein [Anaerolineales bacterium]